MLLELASEHLKIPVGQLKVERGMIIDKTNTKSRVSYGQLAKGRIIERRLNERVMVKSPSEFAVMGKPVKRTDAPDKVTGKARYAGDILLPDILYAKILRPPAHGAKLISVDSSAAQKVEGALIIEERDFVAVLHDYPDEAEKALSQVKAKFDMPEATVTDTTIFEHLLKAAPAGSIAAQSGSLQTGEQQAAEIFQQTYFDGYVAHAAMETHTALVKIEGNRANVWASTQTPFGAKNEVARALGLPCIFCRRTKLAAFLRYSPPPHHSSWIRLARHTRFSSLRDRRLARAGEQYEHVCQRIANRCHGNGGGNRPGVISLGAFTRSQNAQGPRSGRR